MSDKEYDHWFEKFLVAESEKNCKPDFNMHMSVEHLYVYQWLVCIRSGLTCALSTITATRCHTIMAAAAVAVATKGHGTTATAGVNDPFASTCVRRTMCLISLSAMKTLNGRTAQGRSSTSHGKTSFQPKRRAHQISYDSQGCSGARVSPISHLTVHTVPMLGKSPLRGMSGRGVDRGDDSLLTQIRVRILVPRTSLTTKS
jgi:hypothetical protein